MGILNIPAGINLYWDANIFVYIVEGFSPYREILRSLLDQVDQGKWNVVTSELTLAEVLVKPLREKKETIASTYREFLQNSPHLRLSLIDRAVLEQSALIRTTHSVKLPDAIHLATALNAGCGAFLTNDRRIVSLQNLPVVYLEN